MSKVFVLSLHRSATQSTVELLRGAALRTCHWPARVAGVDYQAQVEGIETQLDKIVRLLHPVIESHDALADVPFPALYRELDAQYPGSRFIAIRRHPADWIRSVRKHCGGRALDPYERVQYWSCLESRPASLDEVSDDELLQMHRRHHERMLAHFRGRDDFLLADMPAEDLGERISDFLGVPARRFPLVDYKRTVTVSKSDRHRFHVLGIPHTVSTPDYTPCAFTQKVVRLCAMLERLGHHVIHYGHEHSRVECAEHVTVVDETLLQATYGAHDWRQEGPPAFALGDAVYRTFTDKAVDAISRRQQSNDFLLCMYGAGHRQIADALTGLIVCEPGIGYASGHFAPFKVFESYALLHAYLGLRSVEAARNDMWYDVVIPNYFDVDEFEFNDRKQDYFLFLGRVDGGKGVHIAMQVAEATNHRLIVAGPGSIEGMGTRTPRPVAEYVEQVGVVGVAERRRLLSGAKAVILPSMFVEPFCGVQVEAMLSGTPLITTDWGAFTEYNLHGVTGYRCRNFEQFVWAARNIHAIHPAACRQWALSNFSMARVAQLYEEYFHMLKNVAVAGGWYAENPARTELDWLRRAWP